MLEEDFKFSDFSSFEKDGKKENIDKLEAYLKDVEKTGITFKDGISVGDEVKLKGVDYTVIVEYIDYEIPGFGTVDYAGKRTDKKDELLCLFNQKDVENVIKREIHKQDEELEL